LLAFIDKLERVFDFSAARAVSKRGGLSLSVVASHASVRPTCCSSAMRQAWCLYSRAAAFTMPLSPDGMQGTRSRIIYSMVGSNRDACLLRATLPSLEAVAAPRLRLRSAKCALRLDVVYPLMRKVAQLIYFHKRGLWSAQAWREILGREGVQC